MVHAHGGGGSNCRRVGRVEIVISEDQRGTTQTVDGREERVGRKVIILQLSASVIRKSRRFTRQARRFESAEKSSDYSAALRSHARLRCRCFSKAHPDSRHSAPGDSIPSKPAGP